MKNFTHFLIVIFLLIFNMDLFAGTKAEKLSLKAYGSVKLDAIYETGRAAYGNYAIWAKDPKESNGLFHITANQTLLGLKFTGLKFGKFKVQGKVEVDFYGGGPENKSKNYMRHAYLQISDGSLTIIAGQYWDLICPLNPPTLNYTGMWGAGNIGYRRPQLRIRKDIKVGKHLFTLEGGIFRTIAEDYDYDGVNDGEAAGYPTLQGRIAGKFALGNHSFLQLGISGHYGKTKGEIDYTTNSLNGDLVLELTPRFKILAEYFSGKKLANYMGGILWDFQLGWYNSDIVYFKETLKSRGFFVSVMASLTKNTTFSVGYGVDDPLENKMPDIVFYDFSPTQGMRIKNTSYYGNLLFKMFSSLKVGFEISRWITEYQLGGNQKTVRFQNSWILEF